MILGITGHRSIGGFSYPNPSYEKVYKEIKSFYQTNSPEKVISGMAIGADSIATIIAIRESIPVIAAVPFLGQERLWSPKQQKIYHSLLNRCHEVIIVSEGEYSHDKMQIRNRWIVDNSNEMLAIKRTSQVSGGTFNCCCYAIKQKKKITYIDPTP